MAGLPLTDHRGYTFRLKDPALPVPVRAELQRENGENVLALNPSVFFYYEDGTERNEAFESAVFRGMKRWEGVYSVFGGQKLTVKVYPRRLPSFRLPCVTVIPVSDAFAEEIGESVRKIPAPAKYKQRNENLIRHRRSFSVSGLKWNMYAPKIISVMVPEGADSDTETTEHTVKHEFGHILGLGDLYESRADGLNGVPFGTFPALDGYYIKDKEYDLVMCRASSDVHSPDVEMVLTAFRDNEMQCYQPQTLQKKISEVLFR